MAWSQHGDLRLTDSKQEQKETCEMKAGVGILGLLLALLVVGLLAKKQLGGVLGTAPGSPAGVSGPAGTPQQQSQQLQEQIKKSVEDAMQQKRPESPDE